MLGVKIFGENRVQEFQEKERTARVYSTASRGQAGAEFHLIGHLQSNKSARAAELFRSVDTLDSVVLAERLNQAATRVGRRLAVLIEIKLSPEAPRTRLEPDSAELSLLLERLPDLAGARVSRADISAAVLRGFIRCATLFQKTA